MTSGVFLNDATGAYPVTVLGAVAAQRLGITDAAARHGGLARATACSASPA